MKIDNDNANVSSSGIASTSDSTYNYDLGFIMNVKSDTEIDLDATHIRCQGVLVSALNVTIDVTGTGANGMDEGTLGADAWASVWLIYNPTTSTSAGLVSMDSTPVMPDGYTLKRLVGYANCDSTNDFITRTQYGLGGSQHRDELAVADWTNATLTHDSNFHTLDLSRIVPPNTKAVNVSLAFVDNLANQQGFVAKTGDNSGFANVRFTTQVANQVKRGNGWISCDASQQIDYWISTGMDTSLIYIMEWEETDL